MSLFLGKIHYWLYNKIIWAEKMEQEILVWAKTEDLPVDQWEEKAISQYGESTGNKPLEDVIDTGNIHGWLQERIESAELRQAYIVTMILEANPELKDEMTQLFVNQGKAAAKTYDQKITTPEKAFNALNDFILEGMPCDRINEVISSDETKYIWRTTACLHKLYWDQVEGDIGVFYELRDTWVKGFIEALAPGFSYTKTKEAVHQIKRK